jgi:Na+-transporting methylmalonyl-CoA/oxaloacetate decarboxylase beta subunit
MGGQLLVAADVFGPVDLLRSPAPYGINVLTLLLHEAVRYQNAEDDIRPVIDAIGDDQVGPSVRVILLANDEWSGHAFLLMHTIPHCVAVKICDTRAR